MGFSCFIITKNEARKLRAVILSVIDLADEVIVIDSGSTDDTVAIAEAAGARVIHHDWPGYGPQKRFGEEQCRNDWLLNLDGDEVLSETLRAEIKALFAKGEPPLPGYWLRIMAVPPFGPGKGPPKPWRFNYIDRIRLYDRRRLRFPDHKTWDAIDPPKGAPVVRFKGIVEHYWMKDFAQQLDKMNRYTSALAENVPEKSELNLTMRLVFGFPFDFFRAFILRGHILGGRYGFAAAMLYAFTRMMRTVKMLERKWRKQGQ
jgi:glycosyltransferase involved in cell wall biosynthesis